MKQAFKKILILLVVGLNLVRMISSSTPQVAAAAGCSAISGLGGMTLPIYHDGMSHTIKFEVANVDPADEYYIKIKATLNFNDEFQTKKFLLTDSGSSGSNYDMTISLSPTGVATITLTFTDKDALGDTWFVDEKAETDEHFVNFYSDEGVFNTRVCEVGTYKTPVSQLTGDCSIEIRQTRETPGGGVGTSCYASPNACFEEDAGGKIFNKISVRGLEISNEPYTGTIKIGIAQQGIFSGELDMFPQATNGEALDKLLLVHDPGTYSILVSPFTIEDDLPFPGCSATLTVSDYCNDQADPTACQTTPVDISSTSSPTGVTTVSEFLLCDQINKDEFPAQYDSCVQCVGGEGAENKEGIWTAIGCIKREPQKIVVVLVRLGLMMGGGIALLMILISSFRLSISQGDPKAKDEARDMITAAFVGLVFIIFSVVIFQFVGVQILHIPGIGG
jgi:hypothetical protein